MSIPERFIQRPIATTLVMLAILLFGLASYRILPVSDLPNVDYPTINVYANVPGANTGSSVFLRGVEGGRRAIDKF